MTKLLEPQDQGELAFIRSLLDANHIHYFVQNEHFGSLYPGLPFVSCAVMVHDADARRAERLIQVLLKNRLDRSDEEWGQVRPLREPE
jgi:putative signal transducing protein